MKDTIEKINKLKKELDTLRPLSPDNAQRLWEKLRLDWNYNSSHIEGNTLTYGETQLLLKLGDNYNTQNNSLKDVKEMQAHDVALHMVQEWARDAERTLTENDIRSLNKIILVSEYWRPAKSSDGTPTRKKITPGTYKSQPNHVILPTGKTFSYTEPENVSSEMHQLMDWYKEADLHPVVKAAFLHYKFVRIHPFDDGNGRVSRLLMNYHMLRNGYPPIIIKTDDKQEYFASLHAADMGNLEAFMHYVGTQLVSSLEVSITAAHGESITEPTDIDKEIELLNQRIKSRDQPKNAAAVLDLYSNVFKPLIVFFISKAEKLDRHYKGKRIFLNIDAWKKEIDPAIPTSEEISDLLGAQTQEVTLQYQLENLNHHMPGLHHEMQIRLSLSQHTYTLHSSGDSNPKTYSYHEHPSEVEKTDLVLAAIKKQIQTIDSLLTKE